MDTFDRRIYLIAEYYCETMYFRKRRILTNKIIWKNSVNRKSNFVEYDMMQHFIVVTHFSKNSVNLLFLRVLTFDIFNALNTV